MKKLCLLAVVLLVSMAGFSQDESKPDKVRSTYINLGYAESKLTQDDFPQLTCDWGAFFGAGKTFYLHKTPVLGMIKFGIDATWFDLTYARYQVPDKWGEKETFHHGEASIHVGPSVTITPVRGLNVIGYFRYAPTFSAMYANDEFNCCYATRFVGGASVSYRFFGVGIESRFGGCKYNPFSYNGKDDDVEKIKTSLTGYRVYITFRF